MQKFIQMKTKIGGVKKNSEVEIEVNDGGTDVRLAATDDEEQAVFAPLQVRILDNDEQLSYDFQETKTISDIVSDLRGNNASLNDLRLDSVLNATKMFSGHAHSVIPDEPVKIENVVLFNVTVDIDSALSVFKRRSVDSVKIPLSTMMKNLTETLGASWTGFHCCTSYCANNEWIKAVPSNKTGGPTVEPFKDDGRFRIRLPTPQSSEVLRVYLYSPKTMNYGDFVQSVKSIIHKCASVLLKQSGHERLYHALQSSHEMKLHGGKPCQVPGGYSLALLTALQFLEEHPKSALALETYNCKQKNLHFKMPASGFGSDEWLNSCVSKIVCTAKTSETMIKVMCRVDRLAEMDPTLSSIGFGFELRLNYESIQKSDNADAFEGTKTNIQVNLSLRHAGLQQKEEFCTHWLFCLKNWRRIKRS